MLVSISHLFPLALLVVSLCTSVLAAPLSNEAQALQYYEYRQEHRFKCSTELQQRREWCGFCLLFSFLGIY